MDNFNSVALANKLGIAVLQELPVIQGRYIKIKHYPATDSRPHIVKAIWKGFNGKRVVKALRDPEPENGWSNSFDHYAIQAAGKYMDYLNAEYPATVSAIMSSKARNPFKAVLSGIAKAYDGESDDCHAIIVTWRDARQLRDSQVDAIAKRASEIELIRLDNDINGNPRYYMAELETRLSDKELKELGFGKYRGKKYGSGYVAQSYNIAYLKRKISEAENNLF